MFDINDKKLYQYYLKTQSLDGDSYHKRPCIDMPVPITPATEYLRYLSKIFPLDLHNLSILDVGPRTFETYHYLLQNFSNKITGVEVNKSAIEKSKIEGTGLLELDAHFIGTIFQNNTFDMVLSFHSLEHMLDPGLVVQQMNNVLKPKGILYLVVPVPTGASEDPYKNNGHWLRIDNLIDMVTLCEKHGLKCFYSEHIRTPPNEWKFRGEEGIYLFKKE